MKIQILSVLTIIGMLLATFISCGKEHSRVNELIGELEVLNAELRQKAAEELGMIRGRKAVPHLIALLQDKDEDIGVRESAAKALGRIKDERAIEALTTALKDEDVDLRWRDAEEFRKNPSATGVAVAHFTFDDPHSPMGGYTIDTSKDKYGRYHYIYAFKEENGEVIGTTNIAVPDPHNVSEVTFDFSDPARNYVVEKERSVIKAAAGALTEMKEDKRATKALITALEEGNVKAAVGAYKFFLEERMPSAEDVLVRSLNAYGDKAMAEDLLNSGNSKLKTAAQNWLEQHK